MLDKTQKLRILEQLYQDARIHAIELQSNTSISRQTISRLRKTFWDNYIIQSAPAVLNAHVLNLQYFFMEIKTNPAEPELLSRLKQIPGLISIDGVIGEYALIVKFELPTKTAFADILNQIDQSVAQSLFQSYRIIETIDVFKIGGIIINRQFEQKFLDESRWKLLNLLRKNCNPVKWPERTKNEFFSEDDIQLIEKINLSREIERMEREHIIERFTITIDPTIAKIPDLHTKFFMRIKPRAIGQYTELAAKLQYHPNIIELYRTGEDAGLLAIVRTEGLKGFKSFINELYSQYPVLDSYTTVVIDEHMATIFPPTLRSSRKECGLE
jgi:DNA-binding Lrp family transcriptional regulator